MLSRDKYAQYVLVGLWVMAPFHRRIRRLAPFEFASGPFSTDTRLFCRSITCHWRLCGELAAILMRRTVTLPTIRHCLLLCILCVVSDRPAKAGSPSPWINRLDCALIAKCRYDLAEGFRWNRAIGLAFGERSRLCLIHRCFIGIISHRDAVLCHIGRFPNCHGSRAYGRRGCGQKNGHKGQRTKSNPVLHCSLLLPPQLAASFIIGPKSLIKLDRKCLGRSSLAMKRSRISARASFARSR